MMLALKDAGSFRTSHFILNLGGWGRRQRGWQGHGVPGASEGAPWRSDWDLPSFTPSVQERGCLYLGNEMGYGMRVGYQGAYTKGSQWL